MNPDWLMSTQGRLARIAAGTALILIGLGLVGGFFGVILLLIGAVPIASAAYGALLIGPLYGRDVMGRRPEDQPKEESEDDEEEEGEDDDEPSARDEGDEGDEESADTPKTEPDWSAPPVATAERPEGQEPRTRDLRTDDD